MKILWGVTGIGYGHTYRQLPLIEHFAAEGATIVIYAYDRSWEVLSKRFANHDRVTVLEVAVPFWSGGPNGLDFTEAMLNEANWDRRFFIVNIATMARTQQLIGKPDLVISDMEPTAAQYAYATDAPLVTIDQQSKFLFGYFPEELNGFTCRDEQARIRMFFPRADARIVCSFFNFDHWQANESREQIKIVAPPLTERITTLNREPQQERPCILVYISVARSFGQSAKEIATLLAGRDDADYHLFIPPNDVKRVGYLSRRGNLRIYQYGHFDFLNVLRRSNGIVCTAGHSLISEAMYLGIPVYAMPVEPYEQHLNAKIVSDNWFGVDCPNLNDIVLSMFIAELPRFTARISDDHEILCRGQGQDEIIPYLEQRFLS